MSSAQLQVELVALLLGELDSIDLTQQDRQVLTALILRIMQV
ncbi:hypothetical protein [Aeromonas enteropelogenes]